MDTVDQKLDELLNVLAYEKIVGGAPKSESDPLLAKLKSLGSEIWVDTGELEKAQDIWKQEMTALTTNNTLANQVVQSGIMDQVIEDTIRKNDCVCLANEPLGTSQLDPTACWGNEI